MCSPGRVPKESFTEEGAMRTWLRNREVHAGVGAYANPGYLAILALLVTTSAMAAQEVDFDIDVARIGVGGRFEPFVVENMEPLADALKAGRVQNDTRLLVSQHPAGRVALLTDQMTYHHVAQGNIEGEPWMVSF